MIYDEIGFIQRWNLSEISVPYLIVKKSAEIAF
jgi:hypothetical protein